jgi:hypothetical protein
MGLQIQLTFIPNPSLGSWGLDIETSDLGLSTIIIWNFWNWSTETTRLTTGLARK